MRNKKPTVAVWKFASCDGCQLSLLDLEDELLDIVSLVDIAYFPEASRDYRPGPYDVSLVEGSITTAHDEARIHEIRKKTGIVISIGACATAGGIQALRNYADVNEYASVVYASPQYIQTLATAKPPSDYIKVDYSLRGCPVSKYQLLEAIAALVRGARPSLPDHSVCIDCKRNGNPCVVVSQREPCLGPVTMSGCDALCPSYHRGCFGCFGPVAAPQTEQMSRVLKERLTLPDAKMVHLYRNFNSADPAFRDASLKIEGK